MHGTLQLVPDVQDWDSPEPVHFVGRRLKELTAYSASMPSGIYKRRAIAARSLNEAPVSLLARSITLRVVSLWTLT